MKIRQIFQFAAIGCCAGSFSLALVAFGVIPTILGSASPPLDSLRLTIFGVIWLVCMPFGLLGGYLGARLPLEGGRTTQMIMAGILGVMFCVPLSCIGLWYAGW